MDLLLRVKGASTDEIARGTAAAEAVLERGGITAEQAARGAFALEGWDLHGFSEDETPRKKRLKLLGCGEMQKELR